MAEVSHVILTGGVGSRLWPLSRQSKPKQYLEIFSDKSLFQLAVERNRLFSKKLIVVGNTGNKDLSERILKNIGQDFYVNIVEATPRNTAPAIAFAAFSADPEDILLVTPADHIIQEGESYQEAVEKAIELAKEDNLVTFGVQPTSAETGYGYIEFEGERVVSFREKPDKKNAESYLKAGNFLWNSGMFCFKANVFLNELQEFAPEVFKRSYEAWQTAEEGCLNSDISMKIPSISVDYAVMEKSDKIKVVPANFQWSDMGSFEAVYDYFKSHGYTTDSNLNMQLGEIKPTFFVGVNNCILISTKDANLVVSKKASQDVKTIYSYLEQNFPDLIR
ncbi:sugar phosphate nucleotidyltransferase [Salegentibacter sp. F188]|uniref:Sugar phosphate nucleotidyltransferase n=1 Tax=Autumnicola patrickiae TaxID=3075591 RepID=A0ABU3DYQ6_9FLAO|nr:sugar phosphate nucleotidyltransferase [Salegentibacter sp. F188]MDT0688846.1 sugar phosphate nucleotidyltransferase [Salegentibacter sp. F188]